MSKYYYVDSENIGDDWINMLSQCDVDSYFLVFYTPKSPHMSYPNVVKLMSLTQKPEFILCHEGTNALDFQLVSYLGYQLHNNPDSEIYIVSKDTGFDSVVHFWKTRSHKISRITSINCHTDNPQPTPVSSDADAISASDVLEKNVNTPNELICGVRKQIIDDIIEACPKDNKSYLHLLLTHFYGNTNGLKIYKSVTQSSYIPERRNWDSKTRFSVLCHYIDQFSNDKNVPIDEELINFLYKNRTNPNNINNHFQNKYGKTLGPQYKKIFKSYIKILSKI